MFTRREGVAQSEAVRRALAPIALVALSGCVGAHYVPTSDALYPPRARDCSIEVFSTYLPDREYEEIGLVEGEGSHWKSDIGDVLPKLKEEACLAGGDAIILGGEQKFSTGEDHVPVLRSVATVIRWTSRRPGGG
jgi:hypothetical protein